VSAYDVTAWSDFAQTVGGGAAAFSGLLFVGVSLNLEDVLRYPGVPGRAAATLGLTVAILLATVFLATPGQDPRVVAVELGLLGVVMSAAALAATTRSASKHRGHGAYQLLSLLLPGVFLVIAGISLWCGAGGGLYWLTAAVAAGFLSATANAWVLLVEIKR
jgi:modulator of FtsH protease